MSRRALVLATLVLACLGRSAVAEEPTAVASEEHRFMLTAPAGYASGSEGPALHSYVGPGGVTMSVSRIDYTNLPAWWRHDRKSFMSQVERGLAGSTTGYKLLRKKTHRVDGVPTLDISFRRKTERGREIVWMRFLFHRRFGIVATAASPARARRARRREGRAFARSLRPWSDS